MSWVKKLSCFLIVLSALSFCGGDAYAQNIFKGDFPKTGGKFGTWVQKQYENFEQKMKEIGESQFATFIGDGVEAAKKGVDFVKGKLKELQDAIKVVKKAINDIKNSTAVKITMLSAQAAAETAMLAETEKAREKDTAAIKSELEMQRVTIMEKLNMAKENQRVSMKIHEDEFAKLTTEEEKNIKRGEIEVYKKESNLAIKTLEKEIANIEKERKQRVKDITKQYAAAILAHTTTIASIGIEIADLIDQEKRKKGNAETDPDKVVESAIDDFSLKEGEPITLEVKKKKEKKRRRKRETASTTSSAYASSIISETEDKKEEESVNSSTSSTMNGKSEALQTAISQTAVQLNALYKYLILELKAIELETANIMSANKTYVAGDVNPAIDICDYEMKEGLLDFLGNAQESIQKAKDKVNEVSDKVKAGVEKVNDAVGAVTAGVGAVVAAGQTISSAVEGMKNGESPSDVISGLEGM